MHLPFDGKASGIFMRATGISCAVAEERLSEEAYLHCPSPRDEVENKHDKRHDEQ